MLETVLKLGMILVMFLMAVYESLNIKRKENVVCKEAEQKERERLR